MRSATAPVHVALLRGINVGGKNILPMRDLAAMFADAGCSDVQTYIQSGNVVFRAAPALVKRVPRIVAEAIRQRFGFQPPIVIRSALELAEVASRNPFLKPGGGDDDALHVMFLSEAPTAQRIAALDPRRSPGDSFKVCGRDIYLHLPKGMGRCKLTNVYFDTTLATTSTSRNWRTVRRLLAMAAEA